MLRERGYKACRFTGSVSVPTSQSPRVPSHGQLQSNVLLDRLLELVTFSVEPFAFCQVNRGWSLSLAAERSVQLHFVVEGHGLIRSGAWSAELGPGTLVVVPSDMGHRIEPAGEIVHEARAEVATCATGIGVAITAGAPQEGSLIMICGSIAASFGDALGLFDRLASPIVECFASSSDVSRLFSAMFDEQSNNRPGAKRLIRCYMEQCLVVLFRQLCDDGDCSLPWLAALDDPQLRNVLDVILTSPGANHSVEELADVAGMSRAAFSRKFSEVLSIAPGEFVRKARLRRAAELLRTTDLPIKQVALRVGFSSRSHFSRAFKTERGIHPAKFRRSSEPSTT